MTASSVKPLVRMTGITVAHSGIVALDDVNIQLFPGEVHALMGQNGAGKTTLVHVLTGARRADSGMVIVDGISRRFSTTHDSAAAGIAAVFQDVALLPNLSVAENIMLGNEASGWLGLSWRTMRRRAAAVLAQVGLRDVNPRAQLSTLMPATQQLVAIARALVGSPRILVLDEPTASLEPKNVEHLYRVIRRLKDSGVAILLVSHLLEQVYAISDRMTILRDGRCVGEYQTADLDRADLIAKMIGKELAQLGMLRSQRQHSHPPESCEAYRAERLGRRDVLAPTDIDLHRGEIVGIAGLQGSGGTELASLMCGRTRFDSGATWVNGMRVALLSPRAALGAGVAMAGENRLDQGLIGEMSVEDNIILALQALRGWRRRITKEERSALVERYAAVLGFAPGLRDVPVRLLSGGAQQKVVLAKWLAAQPKVLLLDEPTQGIDVAAKLEIQRHVVRLAADGMAIVYISSELEEVVRLSDRIVIMKDREKIGEVSNGPAVTVDSIVEIIAASADD